jgi:hypothetical protein
VAQKKPKPPTTQVDRREDILNRLILQNDENAVPEFRKLLGQEPELADIGGNLAQIAEDTLVKGLARGQLCLREMLMAKLMTMRTELAGPQPKPIERLLVERVVACWLQVYHADAMAAQAETRTFAQGDYQQRQQDRAHRRFLSAVKTLATVRRLALPTLVAVSVTGTVETKEAKPALESRPWRLPAGTNN